MAEYTLDLCTNQNNAIENGHFNDREAARAFQNTTGQYDYNSWSSDRNSMPCWIGYHFTEAKRIEKYTLTCMDTLYQHYSPKSWQFQGSTNGDTWVTVHTVNNESAWVSAHQVKEYTFDNTNSYLYYRFLISENYSTNYPTDVEIDEIEMMEKLSYDINPDRPDLMTELYGIGSCGNLRGKSSEGFIRPTIKQFFTSENFEEIESAPVLTGYTIDKCEGGIATASSYDSSKYYPENAFDNDDTDGSSSEWIPNNSSNIIDEWIAYQFSTAKQIEKIKIKHESWPTGTTDRVPNEIAIEGSLNGTSWDTLSIKILARTCDWQSIEFSNTILYTYYRLRATDVSPGGWWGVIEIEMMEGIYE